MYIGIDIGGMSVKAGVVDKSGKILMKQTIPTGPRRPMEEIISDIALLTDKLIKESGIDKSEFKSIGIGVPGATDSNAGKIVYCNNINLDYAPIADEIHKYINIPVYLNNDANVAALAEYYHSGKNEKCFLAVTLGTGVGGGIILNGKIFSDDMSICGEFGHIVISDEGELCNCGRRGCWEAYASVTALIRQTKEAMYKDKNSLMNKIAAENGGEINGKTSFDAAKQGDKTALKVVSQFIHYISTGISNLVNIFRPETIVIGGAISKEGDYLLNPIKENVYKEVYGHAFAKNPDIKIAKLGNDAGIIGAALLGRVNGVE